MSSVPIAILATALSDDPRQAVRLARLHGFSGVLFDAVSPSLDLTQLTATGRREFRHILDSHARQLVGLRTEAGRNGFSPSGDSDRLLHRLDHILEAAAGLSAPLVCFDVGPLPTPPEAPRKTPPITPGQAGAIIIPTLAAVPAPELTTLPSIPPAIDLVLASAVNGALAELGRLADRYSVTVAFRTELAGFAALQSVLQRAACPWFGVDLCPVSIQRDDWDLDEILSRLGPLIRHVRGADAVRGADRRTRPAPVGQGNTDWRRLLAALDEVQFKGWITIDPIELPNRLTAATAGLTHLRLART